MNNDNEIVKDLIAGGIIGATLGALIVDDHQEDAVLGAIAGAVILATFKANEAAKQTNVPFYVQENAILYEIASGGTRRFVKSIEKPKTQLNKHFILE